MYPNSHAMERLGEGSPKATTSKSILEQVEENNYSAHSNIYIYESYSAS